TPTSTFYLGGFDAVYMSPTEHMFYTDQQGSIQHIKNTGSWTRSYLGEIVSDVKPGSPISASHVTGNWQSDEVMF
ncbi:MAG: hypothetical protein ACJ788_07040, partial [Ktedonobacteraceae bacterium]